MKTRVILGLVLLAFTVTKGITNKRSPVAVASRSESEETVLTGSKNPDFQRVDVLGMHVSASASMEDQKIGTRTSQDSDKYDFLTLLDGSVLQGEVIKLAAGILFFTEATVEENLQIPKTTIYDLEFGGVNVPETLSASGSLDALSDVIFLNSGRILSGLVTQINDERLISEAGTFSRKEVWRVLFARDPIRATEPPVDPPPPADDQDAVADTLPPGSLGKPTGFCWQGTIQVEENYQDRLRKGRMFVVLEELKFSGGLGMYNSQLMPRNGFFVFEEKGIGGCSGRFKKIIRMIPGVLDPLMPWLITIQSFPKAYTDFVTERSGKTMPVKENFYIFNLISFKVPYRYQLFCPDARGIPFPETIDDEIFFPPFMEALEGQLPELKEGGTRMQGRSSGRNDVGTWQASWDLKRGDCTYFYEPPELLMSEDDDCNQDWRAKFAAYDAELAVLGDAWWKVYNEEALFHLHTVEDHTSAFRAMTSLCGIAEIVLILPAIVKEFEVLLAVKDAIEGIVSGDFTFLLPEELKNAWTLFRHGHSMYKSLNARLPDFRNRLEHCRGMVSSNLYDGSRKFLQAWEDLASATAKLHRLRAQYERLELVRFKEQYKLRERCLACAAEGHGNPGDCPEVSMMIR